MNDKSPGDSSAGSLTEKTIRYADETIPAVKNVRTLIAWISAALAAGFALGSWLDTRPSGDIDSVQSSTPATSRPIDQCVGQIETARREYLDSLASLNDELQRITRELDNVLLTTTEKNLKMQLRSNLQEQIEGARKDHMGVISQLVELCNS